jgi:hypothetical protein
MNKPTLLTSAAARPVIAGKFVARPIASFVPAPVVAAAPQPSAAPLPPLASPVNLPGIGPTVLAGSSTRPLWFDGRFLAASDLRREQHYFLHRQAIYGQAAGAGVLNGLTVEQPAPGGQFDTAETIVIRAGVGLTLSGQLVMLSSDLNIELSDLAGEQNLDEQFGLAETPQQPSRTRTGIYIVALRPVQFSANPIASYPSTLQTPRVTHDGDIVEATAVSLVPFDSPVNNFDAALQRAALARQIFVAGAGPSLPSSMLPLAMLSLDRNVIQWIDMYLVRRDSVSQSSSLRLALPDPATQQAFLMQYNMQLQSVAASLAPAAPNFSASQYFEALPAAGAFPFASIDAVHLIQQFFPQQMHVQLSLIPEDELPALIEESMSLPALDLTAPAAVFANYSAYVLVPVSRSVYDSQAGSLPPTPLNPAFPQLAQILPPVRLPPILRLLTAPPATTTQAPAMWQSVIGGMTYGFYVLQRSEPVYVALTDSIPPPATIPPAPTAIPIVRIPPLPLPLPLTPAVPLKSVTAINPIAVISPAVGNILPTTTPSPGTT